MLLQREGFPEPGEFVQCTVTNIQHSSVFVRIDEYNKTGFIHISEISPGRIRNIRDYVFKGRVIVCLVLKIDEQKGYIDLSLRRVNEHERRKKLEKIKQEQKAEKLIEQLAKDQNKPVPEVYQAIAKPLLKSYEYVGDAFYQVVEAGADLATLGVPKQYATPLMAIVKEKIKPKEVTITGQLRVQSHASKGVEIVKNILTKAAKAYPSATITYLGGGKYKLLILSKDYKLAEKDLKEITDQLQQDMDAAGGSYQFTRQETPK